MASLNYFPDGEAIREVFEPAVKIPLPPGQRPYGPAAIPLYQRGMTTDSPL